MGVIALDIETTGLHHKKDTLILGCYYNGQAGEFVADGIVSSVLQDSLQIWHNGKFDLKMLKELGISECKIDDDTIVAASLLPLPEELDLDLESLCQHYLKWKPWKPSYKKWDEVPLEDKRVCCQNDVKGLYQLYPVIMRQLEASGQGDYYRRYLLPLYNLLVDVEIGGIRIDIGAAHVLLDQLRGALKELEATFRQQWHAELRQGSLNYQISRLKPPQIKEYYEKEGKIKSPKQYENLKVKDGWTKKEARVPSEVDSFGLKQEQIREAPPELNLDSPVQLKAFLAVLGVFLKDKEGHETTSRNEMEYHIDLHPCLKDILKYRDKVKQTQFLESWDTLRHEDRLYTTYNLASRYDSKSKKWKKSPRTGRFSSSEPNLQQVDDRMRCLFLPDEGDVFVGGDFSQIEMRLIAHFTEDQRMVSIFKQGIDFYGQTAINMFGLSCQPNEVKELFPAKRDIAKMVSLAIPYGMWAKTLAYRSTLAGIDITENEARDYLTAWFNLYRGVRAYKHRIGQFALEHGYVRSIYGRKVWLPPVDAEHKALDYRCQSSGHEMTALPQIKIQREIGDMARLCFFLHDEFWYSTKNNQETIDRLKGLLITSMVEKQMSLLKLKVPIVFEPVVINNLGEKK